MAYTPPPAKTEISDTYPNPSNAVARGGFGKLWEYVTNLLGATGNPPEARALLSVDATGPCARAYLSANQAITPLAWTRINLNAETFDYGGRFNNTGAAVGGIPAYAFMPDVAGVYAVHGSISVNGATLAGVGIGIYKNGVLTASDSDAVPSGVTAGVATQSDLVVLNGTTDYVQLYTFLSGTSTNALGEYYDTFLSISLVKSL